MAIISPVVTRRRFLVWTGAAAGSQVWPAFSTESADIAPQPYFASVNRAIEALAKLGEPMAEQDVAQIAALSLQSGRAAVEATEQILDRYTLTRVPVGTDGYPRAVAGGAQRTLIEQGWRLFLVRVANPLGSTSTLRIAKPSSKIRGNVTLNPAPGIKQNWMASAMYEAPPMTAALSGFAVEYRVIQLYSRDRGTLSASLKFVTAADDWMEDYLDLARNRLSLDFECLPSRDVALGVLDVDGRGCMASLIIKDRLGRIYPLQAMRIAPDLQFQQHVYRSDGETVRLPDGEYTIESKRGPEYLREVQSIAIGDGHTRIDVKLRRWIDPAKWGWYSGDTHIHAAGCAHYERPTLGVSPETIIRQVRGEALSIADVLTWGPGYYYQKQFFTGHVTSPPAGLEHPELQVANNTSLQPRATPKDTESLIRYDVELSGFPSSHAGHLVLLRLKDQDYPDTKLIEDWPSWNLPVLRWARAQGAIAGYAHCAAGGMAVATDELPNYEIPPFDGVGTNEAIIDVTHGVVDFLSGCEFVPSYELNAWYHMLNCGFRLAMVGETDFPCISDERPGVGRTYVRLDHRPLDDASYDAWIHGVQQGKLYCGDGRSHFLEFTVNGRARGAADVTLAAPGTTEIRGIIAARLEPEPTAATEAIRTAPIFAIPSWHLERARVGNTRNVAVELVVNGVAVDRAIILADGMPRPVRFKTAVTRSCWVALRILPSGYTHPIYVLVGNQPIRASTRSAQWCRSCVDKLWQVKSPFIRASELSAAAQAFDHARKTYDEIAEECEIV
jgi:N-methylcarbamate hydrolase